MEANKQQILTDADRALITQNILSSLASGETKVGVTVSATDKAAIVAQVLAELYAKSQDVKTLEKVYYLDGITSIPAIRDSDEAIVSIPLNLLTTNRPIEISGQSDIDILVAQGKIIPYQLYFTPIEEE